MKIKQINSAKSVLEISKMEITLLSNALNEICNGPSAIEAWEFPIRTGYEKKEAESLLKQFGAAIKKLQ
jgi:hypothetical protein